MSMALKKEKEVTPHSREKRKPMQQDSQWSKRYAPPVPVDGQQIPDPAAGWVPDAAQSDAHIYVAGVKVIRMTDGSTRKFYRLLVRPAEVKRKRELATKKLKQIRREIREAEKKEAKQRKRQIRVVLAVLGR